MQRQKAKSDEWYTPRSAVEAIVQDELKPLEDIR